MPYTSYPHYVVAWLRRVCVVFASYSQIRRKRDANTIQICVVFASYSPMASPIFCVDICIVFVSYYLPRICVVIYNYIASLLRRFTCMITCVVFASYSASELHRFCVVLVLRSFAKVASQPALKLHRCCVPVLRLFASILHRCLP